MTVALARLCGARDEIAEPSHEPVRCFACGDRMRAYQPPAWIIDRLNTSKPEGNQHG